MQVLDYGILDNHHHVVLRNRPDIADDWSEQEVMRRWWYVCPRRRNEDGSAAEPTKKDLKKLKRRVDDYRRRLSDISWIMRLAQQRVARRANKEDGVRGRFFAERFGSEPLLDEGSVLQCSLYVDLNRIHAGIDEKPEESTFTSAYERIQTWWKVSLDQSEDQLSEGALPNLPADAEDHWLAPVFLDERADAYVGPTSPVEANEEEPGQATPEEETPDEEAPEEVDNVVDDSVVSPSTQTAPAIPPKPRFYNPIGARRVSDKGFLPIKLEEYLTLLDAVGRIVRPDKRGSIPAELPPILERLGAQATTWIEAFTEYVDHWSAKFAPSPELAPQPSGS